MLLTATFLPYQQPATTLLGDLQLAAVVHRPGGVRVWAGTSKLQSREVVAEGEFLTARTMCVFQTHPDHPDRATSYGWRYRLTVGAVLPEAVSVRVEWRRAAPEAGEASAREVTLRRGEAVTLDRLLPGPVASPDACDATAMDLEVRICGGSPDPCRTHGWE